ncbi:MAG: AMP-binding protein [Muribaculaceae bacterium]|nr:AMP-binding protein [Muribaculaceae bacterium]MDE6753957.1 AMP-binding protein [Muribaculaceae bacterium]
MSNTEKTYGDQSLNKIIEDAIKNNWERMALSDMGGKSYKFSELAECVSKLHILFEAAGVKTGDKVAICGKNSADWAAVFVSCLTYGAVAVPILHEFKPENIHNLVEHSEAKLLFVDHAIMKNLEEDKLKGLTAALYLSEEGIAFSRSKQLSKAREDLNELFGKKFPKEFSPEDISYYRDSPDDLAVINYTSGSTGSPKGVMLPYLSIWSNIRYCIDHLHFMKPGDGMINMLPLGHLYGMVIEMLHPLVKGCHCCFLTKAPSPRVLLSAFAEVRPKLIITVPLVLEKIIKSKVFPELEKPLMKFLLAIPFVNDRIYAKVKAKLVEVFGGEIQEIIIGGAPLNAEVEKFLYRIKFPITVGYGMTECGPLLTYATPEESQPHTVGRIVDRMEVKIDSPDPVNVPGNIMVKGANVMKGYYKNEKATAEVFPNNDGWMNTGDMGTISPDGFITISGRSKTMILGPSGQNIYPEEIEQKINNMPYVEESLVIDDNGKLVALIFPNYDEAKKKGLDDMALDKLMEANLKGVNKELESFSRISNHELVDKEFEKTPKRSIKRFLYQR